jgi:hypothetical protein
MLIATTPCVIYQSEGFTAAGENTFGRWWHEKCAIVRMRLVSAHTTVRADQSASRGYAEELTADFILLLKPTTKAKLNDRIDLEDVKVQITSMSRGYSPQGHFEHYLVGCELWASKL